MSNQIVGRIYQEVIDKVLEESRNDVEERGVDVSILDEIRQIWQDKLTALNMAIFPWDLPTEPQLQAPTVPSNMFQYDPNAYPTVSKQEQVNLPNSHAPIKNESPYEPPLSSYTQHHASGNTFDANLAQQRAQALINQRMNPNASPALQMHQQQQKFQIPMHTQQQQQQQHILSGQVKQQSQPQQMQQLNQRPPPPNHTYPPQTDGAESTLEDWNALMQARAQGNDGNDGNTGRLAADQLMRTQIDAMMANQDNGLGMPLSQMAKGEKRKAITRVRQARQMKSGRSRSRPSSTTAGESSGTAGPSGFDGGDEDEDSKEDPEDAINSELDDSEDDKNVEDGSDDDTMEYMLCTYEKVGRVKAKWKFNFKDGILFTNKKEYLFHKATGDFEWY